MCKKCIQILNFQYKKNQKKQGLLDDMRPSRIPSYRTCIRQNGQNNLSRSLLACQLEVQYLYRRRRFDQPIGKVDSQQVVPVVGGGAIDQGQRNSARPAEGLRRGMS